MSTEPLVKYRVCRPGVAELSLNRPAKRNALTIALMTDLLSALDQAEQDTSNRVLVVTAEGGVFCAGMDLEEAQLVDKAPVSSDLIQKMLMRLANSKLITLAKVRGAAIAGGAGIMSACDFVVAEESAKFGYPEVHRGLVAALVLILLRRQLRERDVRELTILGEIITAPRAREIGLINRAVPAAELDQACEDLIARILLTAPQATIYTKQLIGDLWPGDLNHELDLAHEIHLLARKSPESSEGMQAFLAKRKPSWQVE